ncbi:DUF4236 domain-containing protein [Sphingomonas sp. GCM10030256]|uniref:DUF4236 domain-containing protein n=1 Tax=Sphingomonas sp. GCM10030256 TaxID=3273427 RepID=UPI00361F1254
MVLRFRQSFQLFPGVRLNVSKSGLSASFGVPGATVNVGPKGVRSTVGLPGTGLSYTHHHGSFSPQTCSDPAVISPQPAPEIPSTPNFYQPFVPAMQSINSATVEQLTSHSLVELRDMIAQARSQKNEVEADLVAATVLQRQQTEELDRRQRSFFRYFMKKRIAELEQSAPETAAEVQRLTDWQCCTHIEISFETGPVARQAYGALTRAFEKLRCSASIWDVTSDRSTNKVVERTMAGRTLTRTKVSLGYTGSDLIRFDGRAMQFENANGEEIMIYPGMVIMPRSDGAFALIDLREVTLGFSPINFHEDEGVPSDTKVVGQTWAKVNKDGSPDRRFANNYAIPVCLYGGLTFTSPGGVLEEYQFSDAMAAAEFTDAFHAYQAALSAG